MWHMDASYKNPPSPCCNSLASPPQAQVEERVKAQKLHIDVSFSFLRIHGLHNVSVNRAQAELPHLSAKLIFINFAVAVPVGL